MLAVRRAQKIGLSASAEDANNLPMGKNLKSKPVLLWPRTHPIIPDVAQSLSHGLGKSRQGHGQRRSACIAQARRPKFCPSEVSAIATLIIPDWRPSRVRIGERIQHWLILAHWMGAHADTHTDSPRQIHLIGPNMPAQATIQPKTVDLLASSQLLINQSTRDGPGHVTCGNVQRMDGRPKQPVWRLPLMLEFGGIR
jgi:hypothetical protein